MESVYKCRQADDNGYRVRRSVGVISFPRARLSSPNHIHGVAWRGRGIRPSHQKVCPKVIINFGGACQLDVLHDRSNEVGLIRKHQKEVVTLKKSKVPVKGVSSSDSLEAFLFP